MAMRALFIGGTGIISTEAARRAVAEGVELTLLNRGQSSTRPVPDGARVLHADVRDPESVRSAVGDLEFDAVVEFMAFTPEHVQADLDLFTGRTGQYVFISSASAYQTPPTHLPVVESTPLRNPFWEYSRNKIACEDLLVRTYRDTGLPMTIVRPSHTYDATLIPMDGGWTVIDRMRRGLEVVVPGDGTSRWTITHSADVAVGLVGLLGREEAIGEAFHITGDEAPSWDQIYLAMARAAGVDEPRLVQGAADAIAAPDPAARPGLVGDKSHTMIFDNTKLRRLVPQSAPRIPFAQGAREIVAWHDADPSRREVDAGFEALTERLLEAYRPRAL